MTSVHQHPAPALPDWIGAMLPTQLQRYRVDIGGRLMHVMECGEGRPVLMVHGNPTWGFLYRKVVERLAGEPLRIIIPDLIGLGLSDKPAELSMHKLDNHIGWMHNLIEDLDLRDVILVVQDWGGPVGAGALARSPERMTGIVVLNTVLSPPRPNFKSTLFHKLSQTPVVSDLLFRGGGFPQAALWAAQGDRSSIRGKVSKAYQYPLRKIRERAAPLAMARMVPDSFEHPSIEPLRAVQEFIEGYDGPAAIVWGDKDPVLGSIRTWIEKLLPQAEVTRTGAGHFLQEEVPDEIAAAIRRVAGL